MDHYKDIESTLNALLLNATELQKSSADPLASTELSDQQKRLLDHLFNAWNRLSEDEKRILLETKIEIKMLELAKKNKACLREVGPRLCHKSFRP
ncbi:MAG: hypothetical protein ACRDFB_03900 [Rhabdochlamydiaceae bacterium]